MGHADPKRGIVVSGPIPPGYRNGRQVFVVERAGADLLGCFRTQLDSTVRMLNGFALEVYLHQLLALSLSLPDFFVLSAGESTKSLDPENSFETVGFSVVSTLK